MNTKKCKKCKKVKKVDEFYEDKRFKDGYFYMCRRCSCEKNKEWAKKNKEHLIKYRSLYYDKNKNTLLKKSKLYYEKNKKRMMKQSKERKKELLKTDYGKQQSKCWKLIERLIKQGKLKRKPCLICGNLRSQAHHEDYAKPKEITWLCNKHHRELHRKRRHAFLNLNNASPAPLKPEHFF